MELLRFCFALTMMYTAAQSASIKQRRDTFNPNRLMENYMGMRTDQTSFGSFHPNDLVKTIQTYFQHGGTQLLPNNQWGLAVYNPNEAIEQYVGQVDSPGALGPENKEPEIVKENRVAQMTGFNPDQLNKMLLSGIESETFSVNPATEASGQLGFDADNVNKQLMQDINNSQQGTGSSTPSSGSGPSTGVTTQMPANQNDGFGFNANVLNANLFSGLEYDPNSAMPGMGNFMDNTASTTTASQGSSSSGLNPSTSGLNIVTNLTGSTISGSNQVGSNMAGNADQNGGIFAGSNAGTVPPGLSNGGSTGSSFNPGELGGSLTGANAGAGSEAQEGVYAGSSSGNVPSALNNGGSTGGSFNPGELGGSSIGSQGVAGSGSQGGSNSGNVPSTLNNGGSTGGNFSPGELGGSTNGAQGGSGSGAQGGTLTQTGVVMPAPSGIGAIGGR